MSTSLPSQPPFSEVALEAVRGIKQPLLLYGVVETILIIFLLLMGRGVPSELAPVVWALAILPVLVAIIHFVLEFKHQREALVSQQDSSEGTGLRRIFKQADSPEFHTCMETLMREAKDRIILIGTGLKIIHQDPFMREIMNRAANGQYRLEIYLADPTSPQVQTRLIEEETGDTRPSIGRTGIHQRLETLLQTWKDLNESDSINIKLFTHYPTFALLIVDQDYFVYPYSYATLGTFSPVMHFSVDTPADGDFIKFLDQHCRHVRERALNAKIAYEIRNRRPVDAKDLVAFALYFVPPEDSAFYQFGTQILGYDIWRQTSVQSSWQEQVGDARDFGFHLTLCDALYFLTQAQVKSVWAEIEFLAEEFRPFDLTELSLAQSFPDENSLAVVMDDPTGSVEALHCELVHRVYRQATASNYSLGLAKPTRDKDTRRARRMIERYRAPYILQRFRPHFTLLTNISPGEQSKTYEEFERIFSEQVPERTIRVEKLALMARPTPDEPWVIKDEVKLG